MNQENLPVIDLTGLQRLLHPVKLEEIAGALKGVDFEKSKKIEISYKERVDESYSGNVTRSYLSGPEYFEEEGVLIARTGQRDSPDDYKYTMNGHKLYLLKDKRLALFSFNMGSVTYGRTSGLGYTGDEEGYYTYNAKLERIFRVRVEK